MSCPGWGHLANQLHDAGCLVHCELGAWDAALVELAQDEIPLRSRALDLDKKIRQDKRVGRWHNK